MRVVQLVCSDGFGGVERYISNLSAGLAHEGVQVDVIGGAQERMHDPLSAAGVTWHRGDSPAEALAALRRLPPPDLLNTHMSQADLVGYVSRWSVRRRSVPQVSTRHFGAPRGASVPARVLFRVVGSRLRAQLSISDFVARHIDGPSVIVHSGVANRPEGHDRDRTVLVVQRLEPEKDTETALRAWAESTGPARGWSLVVAGDGAERDRLRGLVDDLGIGETVTFLGFRDDVDELLSRAGLVLAPTPREGLGILVLEAMAAGTPVVASAGGGHLETVGAIEPELLFPPGDAFAAARVMDSLIDDDARRRAAGVRLRDLQRTSFTMASQVAGTLALYRKVLDR